MLVLSAEQRQHALGAELREAVQVERLAVERRLIDLEVAGVEHHALRRVDRHRDAVRHAVRDADEFDRERADRRPSRGLDRDAGRSALDAVLLQLGLDQRERERRAVDRAVDVAAARTGTRADVIFVAVRQHKRLDAGRVAPRGRRGPGRSDRRPSRSGSGNIDAGVDDDVVSPHEIAIMLRPNSPRPPSGTTSTGRRHVRHGGPIRQRTQLTREPCDTPRANRHRRETPRQVRPLATRSTQAAGSA